MIGMGYRVSVTRASFRSQSVSIIGPDGNGCMVTVFGKPFGSGAVACVRWPGDALNVYVLPDGSRSQGQSNRRGPPGEFAAILDMLREAGVAFPGEEDDPDQSEEPSTSS